MGSINPDTTFSVKDIGGLFSLKGGNFKPFDESEYQNFAVHYHAPGTRGKVSLATNLKAKQNGTSWRLIEDKNLQMVCADKKWDYNVLKSALEKYLSGILPKN